MALAAIYLATMGKQGLRSVAEQCYHKAQYRGHEDQHDPRLRDRQ